MLSRVTLFGSPPYPKFEKSDCRTKALMIEGMHVECVIKKAHAGPEIHECVVIVEVPVHSGPAIPELDRLLDVVIAGIDAFGVRRVILRPCAGWESKSAANKQIQMRERAVNLSLMIFPVHLRRAHSGIPSCRSRSVLF